MYLLQNYRGELHEPGTCAHMIENYAGRPICFIDIGAHLGFFSAFAAHLCPENTVYAFEPNPDSFRVLQKNFELNQIRGDICALALSDEVAKVPFKGRSMKVSADDAEMMVDTDRFDLWCERHAIKADVIKIDVHGSEGKVLFGMQETLRHGNLGLYFEVHPQHLLCDYSLKDVVDLVLDSGFEMAEIAIFRTEKEFRLSPVDTAARHRLIDPDAWTKYQTIHRRMFYCWKPDNTGEEAAATSH
jgi:FkbM family methyltransferase